VTGILSRGLVTASFQPRHNICAAIADNAGADASESGSIIFAPADLQPLWRNAEPVGNLRRAEYFVVPALFLRRDPSRAPVNVMDACAVGVLKLV